MVQNQILSAAPDTRVLGAMPPTSSAIDAGYSAVGLKVTPGLALFRREDLRRDELSGVGLGPYALGAKLGEGGMGLLYRAVHQQLGKACAVKFILPSMATNEQAIARFLQEIQAVGQLSHPNIVCAVDAGCCDGVHYYVTELLEGQDLQRLVSSAGPMTLEKSCLLIREILSALDHAHDRGLVHRDIKPSNIFLTDTGHAKLLDFGLARNNQQLGDGLTSSDQLLGTLDYLAPEQAEHATQANAASDLYSLGLTWIYLLSGQSPYPDAQYSTTVSKLRGQLVDQPEWLTRNASTLPVQMRALLFAMIAKDPRQRIRNCREAIARLESHSTHRPRNSLKPVVAGVLTVVSLTALACSGAWSPRATDRQPTVSKPTSSAVGTTTSHAAENVQTLSNVKPTASAKVVRRPGPKNGSPTAATFAPPFNNKQ